MRDSERKKLVRANATDDGPLFFTFLSYVLLTQIACLNARS